MEKPSDMPDSQADWPYASLLVFGFFGASTPAGRQFVWRTTAALAVLAIAMLGLADVFPQPVPELVWVLAIPGSVVGIGWASSRYLDALDELSRMIQLRAFAFSYGAAMVIVSGAFALAFTEAMAIGLPEFLILLLLVEPLRGAALVYLARKYE